MVNGHWPWLKSTKATDINIKVICHHDQTVSSNFKTMSNQHQTVSSYQRPCASSKLAFKDEHDN